ncbi:MFS transporter [Tsukamurella tyrosinosolvens]|uniref:MFS transporter n=1 Tax=Tsukamurella tyrosinosolvens TaxID=57704 RepID=UPI000DF71703|nr:MFS transporter [Tsukamurella tyrosinosolvens]RDB48572.1 MFS transporter [Tsukamurella tyrosinosolvens]
MTASTASSPPTFKDWYRSGVAGMASYLDSAATVSTGIALVLYKKAFGFSGWHLGILSSILTFGVAAGALVGGRLGDRFGRKRVFSVTMVLLAVGALILCLAPGLAALYAGVPVLGFAIGADLPVSLALIAEEAPDGARGKLLGLSEVLWYVGILASQLTGVIVGGFGASGARYIYAHIVIVAVVVLILRARIPESRRWQEQFEAHAQQAGGPGSTVAALQQLVSRRFVLPFVGLALFYLLTNVAANTKGQFGTHMYVEVAGSTVRVASAIGMGCQVVGIVAGFAFMRIVDGSLRRRWYAIGSLCFIAYFGVPAVFGVSVLTLALGNLIGAVGIAFAFEGIYKVWVQEKFPTLLRSTAQGATFGIARIGAGVVAIWTPALLAGGPQVFFATLAAMVFVAAIIGFFVERAPLAVDPEPGGVAGTPPTEMVSS